LTTITESVILFVFWDVFASLRVVKAARIYELHLLANPVIIMVSFLRPVEPKKQQKNVKLVSQGKI